MRIIAGQFRGKTLTSVGKGDAGAHLRPTTDRVRESLFNVLLGGALGDDPITGAQVLDLFAGTGALGLEALSRGAASVTFIESGRKALSLLEQNIQLCGAKGTRVVRRDAMRPGPAPHAHDLVFLDPPYGKGMGTKALEVALARGWLAPGALIVWEENAPQTAPDGFSMEDARKYGDTHITFLRATG
ncbi:16S rRNA (guanine(966)-N(2))-methyltransferase RsmD [Aliiroseovarius sp. PTFE2010]|uniref:16S rRNA (guanine(966)-N(2))-methyltransferase RsmD n=1 Tax=Aliiroseovarius sp. PTFE2010 TaxID=3417190 RepID=UPI003CEDCB7C